jgi:hypothetical protein
MSNIVSIFLEWVYTPENYFEGPVTISFEGGEIEIDQGKVLAEVAPEVFAGNADLADDLDDTVENRFHDAQLKNNRSYDLSMPFKVVVRADGSRIVTTC